MTLQAWQYFHFQRYQLLYLLPLSAVLPVALAVVAKCRRQLLCDQWMHRTMQVKPSNAAAWSNSKLFLVGLFFACGLIALAQPSWQSVDTGFAAGSSEIVAIVDDSRSMAALDGGLAGQPCTRLKASCDSILEKIIPVVDGCPFGLVTFAGQAYPQVLFTRQRKTAQHFLKNIKVSDAPGDGSQMFLAFKLAWKYFDRADKERRIDRIALDHKRVIVLFSDGGMDDKELLPEVVEGCNKRQIQVLIFGVGRTKPTHIPVAQLSVSDRLLQKGEFYTYFDPVEGREVLAQTALEEQALMVLQQGTAALGARYQRITRAADVDLPRLVQGVETVTRTGEQQLFIYPTLLCFLSLLAVALSTGLKPGRHISNRQSTA